MSLWPFLWKFDLCHFAKVKHMDRKLELRFTGFCIGMYAIGIIRKKAVPCKEEENEDA